MAEVDSNRDLKRLRGFYGAVAFDQNHSILQLVNGVTVLELGCGYGTFVEEARKRGKRAFGLDIDFETLEIGKRTYSFLQGRLIQGDIGHLPFKAKSFHAVVLRESLHHVTWEEIFSEILRVCQMEVIIFEPNPNWFLRLARRIISHKDQEVPVKPLLRLLKEHGVGVQECHFRDLIAFPLSGGFVGWEFVPPIKILFPLLLRIDRLFRGFFHLIKIDGATCWRYLVKGILNESGDRR
jgi:SAM-dependent methyltransferase